MKKAMMIRLVLLALPTVLIACVEPQMPPTSPTPPEGSCSAEGLQDLIGQPAARLQTIRFGVTTRIIRPDMAITEDYSAGRLNIYIDDAEKISAVNCG